MKTLSEMSIAELTAELNELTGKPVKKAKGSKESIIEKIENLRGGMADYTYVMETIKRSGEVEWRIMLLKDGLVRWLNMKDTLADAEDAAKRTAVKRGISYNGVK